MPTSTDDVCIGDVAGGTYAVTFGGSAAVHSLTVGGSLGGTQSLTIQGDATGNGLLTLGTGSSSVRANGGLTLSSTNGASSAAIAGSTPLVNEGTFATVQGGGGARYIEVPLTNNATVTVAASDTRQDAATLTTNNATFSIQAGATLALSAGASFADAAGSLAVGGSFTQTGGTFTQSGGVLSGANPLVLTDVAMTDSAGTGSFVLQHLSSLTGTIPPGQVVTVQGGSLGDATLNLLGATITNYGTLVFNASSGGFSTNVVNGTLDNVATVRMAQGGGGIRHIQAGLTNEPGAAVEIAAPDTRQDSNTVTKNSGLVRLDAGAHLGLAGGAVLTESPSASISLVIDAVGGASTITGGTISIAGTLQALTTGSPPAGTSYPVISGGTRSGLFASVQSQGASYGISYTPNAVILDVGSPPTLAISPGSPQFYGTTLNFTATVSPSTATGTVQFVADGSANLGIPVPLSGGQAATSVDNLAVGPHQLTAVFTPGDPTQYAASSSSPVPYTIQQPPSARGTQTGLAVDAGTSSGAQVTFTATVSPPVAPGAVAFSESPTGTVIGRAPPGSGTFSFTAGSLSPGPHTIVALFQPTNPSDYSGSQSPPVTFSLGPRGYAPGAQAAPQSAQGTAPQGNLTITTPYTPTNPLNLGLLRLNSSATMFSATATFGNIAITDARSGAQSITATAQSGDITSGANTIDSQNLGLTGLVATFIQGNGIQPGQVTMFDNPAASPAVAAHAAGSAGLGGGVPHVIATVSHGPGSFSMNGTLTLNAPSSVPSGTYTGTITFTVG